jgi:hypothetical protein
LKEEEDLLNSKIRLTNDAKIELRRLGELPQKVTQFQMQQQKAKEEEEKVARAKMDAMAREKIFSNDPLAFVNTNRMEGETRAVRTDCTLIHAYTSFILFLV